MNKQFISKEILKRFLIENRLSEVLKSLIFQMNEFLNQHPDDIDYSKIQKLSDVLIINLGKYNGLEHDIIIGIIDRETKQIFTVEIQKAILYVINKLPNQFWNFNYVNNIISHKSQLIEGIELFHNDKTRFEYDIFICFSTKDREQAKPIWEILRGYGLRAFVSDEELQDTVGFNFINRIDYALLNSQHLLLLASEYSLNSTFVQDEYQAFYSDFHVKDPLIRLLIFFRLVN